MPKNFALERVILYQRKQGKLFMHFIDQQEIR